MKGQAMRFPRLRFTLRRLMIAVAVIAVGLAATARTGAPRPVKATSPDPMIATRQEKILHGVLWGLSYPQARELAEREGRPILIFFSSITDANSRRIEVSVLPRADVVPWLSRFITIDLYTDYCPIGSLAPVQRAKLGEENQEHQMLLTGDVGTPQFAVLDARGNLVARAADRQRIAKLFPTTHRGGFQSPDRQRIAEMSGGID
jgi:hypothetical protein